MTWGFLKTTGQLFCKMSLHWVCRDFSRLDQGYAFWEQYHKSDVVHFLVHRIWGFGHLETTEELLRPILSFFV